MSANDISRPIPAVDFYGDTSKWPMSELVHCERIAERSELHDWQIRPHRHNDLAQLFLLLQGGGIACVDSERRMLAAPCLLIVPERVVHEFEWQTGSDGFQLSIRSSLVASLAQRIESLGAVFGDAAVIDTSASPEFISDLFAEVHAEYAGKRPFKDVSLECLVRLLAIWLARNLESVAAVTKLPGRAGRHYARFLKLVDDHHKAHWSVADYSNTLGITPSHLNAICQDLAGKSTLEIIHKRLVLAAKRDLAYTESNIAGVAHRLGFVDPSYFSRFFRRETGVSPGEYRRRSGTHNA